MAVASTSVAISAGFSQNFFYVFYYPSLAGFSMTFTSVRLNMAWVTMVCFIYVGISLIIGDGLDFEAEDANPELAATLEELSQLSRSTIWDLRHPISMGGIYEGRKPGRAFQSHATSFTNVISMPAGMTQTGVEPPLSIDARGLLFSTAHPNEPLHK